MDESIVITTNGATAKGAAVASGGAIESNNANYWKVSVVNTSYNRIYSIRAGQTNGNIMAATVAANKKCTIGAYATGTGRWLATSSGNTMIVDGVSVGTYFLKAQANQNLYLTAPADGGQLYLATVMDDTTQQEWYFEASTYVGFESGGFITPTELTAYGESNIVKDSAYANYFAPQWKSSSSNLIYEIRYRTRMYDASGIADDWGYWSSWTAMQASKRANQSGYYYITNGAYAPSIDNTTYSRADVQVSVRITDAPNIAGYNKTGTIRHGAACTQTISVWLTPTFTISAAECTQYGISLTYSSSYQLAGNQIRVNYIRNGATTIAENYTATDLDYQGSFVVPWSVISEIPANGDTLTISAEITESNYVVKSTSSASVSVSYDAESGMTFTPTYTLTNRGTVEAKLSAYDHIECYMLGTDLNGSEKWIPVEETVSSNASYRTFEVIPPFGTAATLKYVVLDTTGGVTSWGTKNETLSSYIVQPDLFYYWNWVDDDMTPHAYIMKYRAGNIVQPGDTMTLPANSFITTGRDYPIFRYNKSISRQLDIDGAILNGETGTYSTKSAAEALAVADHTVYRQPNGKWYQTALKTVAFTRETTHFNIQIQQEAESR